MSKILFLVVLPTVVVCGHVNDQMEAYSVARLYHHHHQQRRRGLPDLPADCRYCIFLWRLLAACKRHFWRPASATRRVAASLLWKQSAVGFVCQKCSRRRVARVYRRDIVVLSSLGLPRTKPSPLRPRCSKPHHCPMHVSVALEITLPLHTYPMGRGSARRIVL